MLDFSVDHRALGGACIVAVHGELDAASAAHLHRAVGEAPARGPLVIDLSRCTFLDSSGFRAVGTVAREAVTLGRGAAVVSPPQVYAVRRVVDLLGLAVVVAVHDDLPGALAAVLAQTGGAA